MPSHSEPRFTTPIERPSPFLCMWVAPCPSLRLPIQFAHAEQTNIALHMPHDRNLRSPSNPAVLRNQVKLSSAQVQAARIVIGKVVPGLKSIEMVDMTGDPEKPIEGTITSRALCDPSMCSPTSRSLAYLLELGYTAKRTKGHAFRASFSSPSSSTVPPGPYFQ
jgi:hypothetical protein